MFTCLSRTLCFSSLIILILLLEISSAVIPHCDPSACGNIRNISYPFRLRDDPRQCGNSMYELVCENNTTLLLPFESPKYLVHSINYHNQTIRLADAAINISDTCSLPPYPGDDLNIDLSSVYGLNNIRWAVTDDIAWAVTFLSCPSPVNRTFYVKADHCFDINVNSSNSGYTYIKVGRLNASEVEDKCNIAMVGITSMPFKDNDNISNQEIQRSLVYGFEVRWYFLYEFIPETVPQYVIPYTYQCPELPHFVYATSYPLTMMEVLPFCTRRDPSIESRYQCLELSLIILLLCNRRDPSIEFLVLQWLLRVAVGVIVTIVLARFIIGVPILLGLLVYKLRRRHRSTFDVIEHFFLHHNNLVPIRYSYSDIKKMTTGFREKLGQGGYGSVYKGKLRSGPDVAVKLLSANSNSNGIDFMNEVATIGRIHHVNVVKLVGYCVEGYKRALLYDFMPNGSLDKYILRQEAKLSLNWEKKYEIALGVARGIEYLHQGCDIQILHFDIKPHNILLDDNFAPKISDFGLAKFFSTEKNTVTLTAARGTIGYVAPELINRSIGGISYKADVYSFGMLLMELVGLNRDLVQNGENSSQYFPDWIYTHLDKWKNAETGIADEEIDDVEVKLTRKMTIVALWCIQMSPGDRPSMSKVVEMLEEGDVESLQIPPQPSHTPEEHTWETDTTDSTSLA